ncbi:MAG: hypothetical protein AAGB00_00620 [Planctomycetota bacterium]
MKSSSLLLGCLLLATAAGGCRSQVGTLYSVASGNTTADDVLPGRDVAAATAGAMSSRAEVASKGVRGVTQAAFAPPPLAGEVARSPAFTSAARRVVPVGANPLPEPSRDEALQAVMADLQRLAATNPAAHQELVRRLDGAKFGLWPSIARRFNSDLAINQQLTGRSIVDAAPVAGVAPVTHTAPSPGDTQPAAGVGLVPHTPVAHAPASRAAEGSGARAPWQPPAVTVPAAAVPPSAYRPSAMPPSPTQRAPAQRAPTQPSPHEAYRRPAAEPAYQPAPTESNAYPPATSRQQPIGRGDTATVRLASAESAVVEPMGSDPSPMVVANPYNRPTARDWRASLGEAIEALELATSDEPLSITESYEHARLRLMRLASGELDGAVTPIPGLSPTEQDYWSKQFYAVATMLDRQSQPENKRRAAAAGLHLAAAHKELRQMASLAVQNVTFCDQVNAYGSYTERASRAFRAGERATVYAEVDNFQSRDTDQGYHTVIGSSFQVLDGRGHRVSGGEFEPVDDYCLSPRRDFQIEYIVALPDRIYPGEYQLELTLNDQLGNKIGRASIDFEIVE